MSRAIEKKAKKYESLGMLSVARVRGQRTKTIALENIEPYQRMPFRDLNVLCPACPNIYLPAPLMAHSGNVNIIQKHALLILEEIDRVCALLGINYFLCGGTMLGYVRNGGFLPWDDDIDIGMPRTDYIRFLKEAPAVIDEERFFLQTRESDPHIPYLFSKVRRHNSLYLTQYNQYRDFHKGFCVDVFPFDAIPNGREKQLVFKKQVRKAAKKHNRIANRQYPPPPRLSTRPSKPFDWLIAQISGRILAAWYWKQSLFDSQKNYDVLVQTYNDRAESLGLEYIASFIPTYTMVKNTDVFPLQRISFEEIATNIIANPSVFLSMQYGDYETTPLPHQQKGHDLLFFEEPENEEEAGEQASTFGTEEDHVQ
jgi:lipopolysaccharide cholinephosphotransferase